MTFVVADRVQETGTCPTGTGVINLAGAIAGYQSFVSGIGAGNTTFYTIYDPIAYTWEVGLGTVASGSPNTLTRTTVYSNSSGTTSKISFNTTNNLTVFVTYPAEQAVYTGSSASLNSVTTTASTTGSTNKGPYNYGTLTYSDTGIFASYQTSVNNYFQMIIQNSFNGSAASADLVVSSDGGTATTNYGNFGINSSVYSGTGPLNAPSMVYLYSQSTDLTIGTNTSNAVHFTINNQATDAMTINAASAVAFNGQYGSAGQVLTSQGSATPPTWTSLGNAYNRTSFTATAGQTTFTVSYTVGYVEVYVNGTLLNGADYTATNGTSVVLAQSRATGDIVETIAYNTGTVTPTNLSVGTSLVQGGTNGYVLYNNSGVVGNLATTGSGSVVLGTSPTIATPTLTTPTITSLYGQNSNLVKTPYNGTGLIPAELFYQLNSTVVGSNVNTPQSLFGVGVTLASNTVYQFEIYFCIIKSAGSTSHTCAILFGGTASINSIGFYIQSGLSSITGAVNGSGNLTCFNVFSEQSSATVFTNSTTNTNNAIFGSFKGSVSISTGGTFIPQYQLSAAPGGAYTTQIGSYVKLSPIGAAGSNINIGGWA